jgi:hypothetical protein
MYIKRLLVGLSVGLVLTLVVLSTLTIFPVQTHAQTGDNAAPNRATKKEGMVKGSRPPVPPGRIEAASVGNGDFENGADGTWTEYSALSYPLILTSTELPAGITPHSGDWVAWLGGDNDEIASISQTVTITSGTSTLNFSMWITSSDTCGYDFGQILVNNTEVYSISLCDETNTNGWVNKTLNLSAYIGQNVALQFRAETDFSMDSSFFIDDVTLEHRDYVYLPIYADALAGDWQDWSWDTTRSFDNAQPVHGGSASIAVTYTAAWGGLYLHTDTALPASDYTAIRFWVHGGSTGDQSVNFNLNDGGVNYPFTVQANTWLSVTIPLAALGNPTTLSDLVWQDGSGNGQPTFYLDDISLVGRPQWNYYVYLPLINKNSCGFYYFDDFSVPTGRWWTRDDADITLDYVNEEYQILLKNAYSDWLQTPDLVLPSNYRIEVDVYQPSSAQNDHGLVFGTRWNGSNWETYQFLIYAPTQEYFLVKRYMNGNWSTLIDWTYSPEIYPDTSNHLRVDRVGTLIRLYINGVQVNTSTDASFTGAGRDAGLRVYSGNSAWVDTRFDNFSATCLP